MDARQPLGAERLARRNPVAKPVLAALAGSIAFVGLPAVASAHTGAPPTPDTLWRSWSFDPFVVAGLLIAAGWYIRGVRTLWARAGTGGGIAIWRTAAYGAGLVAVVVALITPLDALSAALLASHMVQHLLLFAVAPPLIVLGAPATAFLWALPKPSRQRLGHRWQRATQLRGAWRLLSRPAVAWAISVLALWLWHLPALYEAALRSEPVHVLEHASFLATALLFWWAALDRVERRRRALGAILLTLALMVQGGLLGALMTLSAQPWYAHYAGSERVWGLAPLDDQRIAGLIMWVPAGVIDMLAAALMFMAWIEGAERSQSREERRARHSPAP